MIRLDARGAEEDEDLPAHLRDVLAPRVVLDGSGRESAKSRTFSRTPAMRGHDTARVPPDTGGPRLRSRGTTTRSRSCSRSRARSSSCSASPRPTGTRRSRRRRRTRFVFSSSPAARTCPVAAGADASVHARARRRRARARRERSRRARRFRRRAARHARATPSTFIAGLRRRARSHRSRSSPPARSRTSPAILELHGGDGIERIVVMGGSIAEGNITPAAEFNIWCRSGGRAERLPRAGST